MALNALIGSRLDYCNSLFRNLSVLYFCKLQCVQNNLAKIVINTTKYSHITPVRKTLHWLPIEHCSILPHWCTSSYIVAIQNILCLSLNLDKVSLTHLKAKLMVRSLRSHTLPLLSTFASALLMIRQRFGMI